MRRAGLSIALRVEAVSRTGTSDNQIGRRPRGAKLRMIGKTIGKYRITGQLGRGGMGTVYKAVDETLDREVAIKVLNPEVEDSKILTRFRAEATALARLNHPEIATIYELFRADDDLLMVMEFVRGETLEKISTRLGTLAPERAAYLIDKVLGALTHAHRAGIVHCDIKPANLMITEHGGIKIMDFGIARVRGAGHPTIDGYMMGTPAYMPPEQVLGQQVDGRSDLYAVGVVFYRLVTGKLPFEAETAIGTVQKQISDLPTPARTHRPELPEWCDTVLHKALAKAPGERFQTAEEFREGLAHASGMSTTDVMKAFLTSVVNVEPSAPAASDERERGGQTVVQKKSTVVMLSHTKRIAGWLAPGVAFAVVVFLLITLWNSSPPHAEDSVNVAPAVNTNSSEIANSAPAAVDLPPPAAAPAVEETGKPAAPPYMFQAKTLVSDGDRQRERDCRVVVASDKITVQSAEDRKLLRAVPFDSLVSISYSRARNPLWNSPRGPAEVTRAGRGALGIFGGSRYWLSLRVKSARNQFLVLRLTDEAQTKRVVRELEQRTGRRTDVVVDRSEENY